MTQSKFHISIEKIPILALSGWDLQGFADV
jgi:hypothetical protein